jgi:molecular chaperone IbpA
LADYVEVVEGDIINGILVLKLERKIPEAMKPRKIELGNLTSNEEKELLVEA